MSASLGKPYLYPGNLEGTTTASFSQLTSAANFYSLNFTSASMYVVNFTVSSSGGYEFYHEEQVDVKTLQQSQIVKEDTQDIVLRVDADYDAVVGSDSHKYLAAMFKNELQNMYSVLIENLNVTKGLYFLFSDQSCTVEPHLSRQIHSQV